MSRAFHIKKNYTAGTSALSTLVTKQATFVCKYLLAFDHWQTKSNPRNNTESEIAKRELIRLNQTQDFDELSADLASEDFAQRSLLPTDLFSYLSKII